MTSSSSGGFDNKGVVYVGHLPQRFEEQQIFDYFKQFGRIKKVKVSRSIKTGQPKGYGFIQFDDQEVAQIAADSMNNYIMFRKSLKAHVVEPEKVSTELFKNCSRMLAPKKSGQRAVARLNNSSKKLAAVMKRVKRRKTVIKKLHGMGYEFPMPEMVIPEPVIKKVKSANPDDTEATEITGTEPSKLQQKLKDKSPTVTAQEIKDTSVSSSVKRKVSALKVSTNKKDRKSQKTVSLADITPVIIRSAQVADDSDDEISFKTPPAYDMEMATKASSKKKSTAKKVFPKTPIPAKAKSKMSAIPLGSLQTPPSLKKSGRKSSATDNDSRQQVSDASPALPTRTVKVTKAPEKQSTTPQRKANADVVAKTTPQRKTNADVVAKTTPQRKTNADVVDKRTPQSKANAEVVAKTTPQSKANADVVAKTTPQSKANADVIAKTPPQRKANAEVVAKTTPQRKANAEVVAKTPKHKSQKISPRVTRSVAKKRKSVV